MLVDESKKERKKRIAAEWYKANPEYKKNWRAKNRDKLKVYWTRANEKNKEKQKSWAVNNRDKAVARVTKYNKKYPEKHAALEAKRRASKRSQTPKWLTKEQLADIRKMYGEARRLTLSTGVPHHVDHIVPLQGSLVWGLHVPWNLQILRAFDNQSKGNRC